MLLPVLAMVVVGASWTITGFVMGLGPKKNLKADVIIFYECLSSLCFSIIVGLCTGLPETTRAGLWIAILSQVACGFANYFQLVLMSDAMQKGPNGIVWSVLQAGFVFPFFMGIACYGVPLTWLRGLGFLCVLASLFLFCGKEKSGKDTKYGKWLLPTLLAFLATGASQMTNNLPSYYPEANAVSSFWRQAFYCSGSVLCYLLCGLRHPTSLCHELASHGKRLDMWSLILMMEGIGIPITYFLTFPGLDALARLGAGAVGFPIMVSSCLIAFELFTRLFLHEKRTLAQQIALLFCIFGVIALSIN